MAPHEDGENNFSDDDFLNDLPADALTELENNAIAFTQARTKPSPSSDHSNYGDEFDDEDLDDGVVIDEARSAPAVVPYVSRNSANPVARQEQPRQQRHGDTGIANRLRNNTDPPLPQQPDHLPQPFSISREASNLSRQASPSVADGENDALRKLVQEVFVIANCHTRKRSLTTVLVATKEQNP